MTKHACPPKNCQVCNSKITDKFVDASLTIPGQGSGWGNVCPTCHESYGHGLGTGVGQLYEKQGEEFVKIAG